jgi:hypothetical protein
MNRLHVGFHKRVELPKRGYLFIGDELPDVPQARIFDPLKHSFNPLKNIDYRKAREIADIIYTAYPQGENTLTVRNGKRALLRLLMQKPKRLHALPPIVGRDDAGEEARAAVADILMSPVLQKALCNAVPPAFSFNTRSVILARINRAELGDFDALVLGLFLMTQFKGQIVCPDFGFYGRDVHLSLIREKRLIAGINFLAELSPKLRNGALLIEEKEASGATFEDARTLAAYEQLVEGTVAFNDFVQGATR